jgi:HlyD family secretion protein
MVQVGSQVSGNVQALYADYNTKVTNGQIVARIDPAPFQARVDQAAANLNAARAAVANAQASIEKSNAELAAANAGLAGAKANGVKGRVAVDQAKIDLDRKKALAAEGVLARQDQDTSQGNYDSAVAEQQASLAGEQAARDNVTAAQAQVTLGRTQLASAEAQVKQCEAALQQAQLDLNHTSITAPVDGVVVARQIDVGQTVAASLQAPTLFQIAQDLTKMQADINVSEADVGRVQVGQSVRFTVDAYPGTAFNGTVASIRKAPINVQNVVTYDVVVTADNPDLKLFPGMTANAGILVERHENVLKVPNAALRFHPSEAAAPSRRKSTPAQQQTVWVMQADAKNMRPAAIRTGLSDGSFTEVTGGDLKEGDRVVLAAMNAKGAPRAASTQQPRTRGMGF